MFHSFREVVKSAYQNFLVYKENTMALPSEEKIYDLLIIGGGPAGGAAAETALKLGKSVAMVEKDKLGGT